MKLVISSSHGTENPTMAVLPWAASLAGAKQGHQVILWLQNEAVETARLSLNLQGVGLPKSLQEYRNEGLSAGVKVWLCKPCATVRKIEPGDDVTGSFNEMPDYVKAVTEADRTISF